MSNIGNINKYILKLLRTVRSAGFDRAAHPARDWVALFIIFVVIIALSLVFSISLLFQVQRSEFAVAEQREIQAVDTIDRILLEKTLGVFMKKERALNELKGALPKITDPSI